MLNRNNFRNKFGRDLIKPQILQEACKNRIKISADNMAKRRKSERLVQDVLHDVDLSIKVDNVDELEFYCVIYRRNEEVCALYKDWASSFFHIQDEIKISRLGRDFERRFYNIHNICSLNFVVMLFPPVKSFPEFDVVLQMGICEYGFNEDTLRYVISNFEQCRERIKPFMLTDEEWSI